MIKSRTEYSREYRRNNPGKSALYTRNYRLRNPELTKERANRAAKEAALKGKLELLRAYGGKCACCGEDRFEFLSLDHMIPGDGKAHRAKFRTPRKIYAYLKSLGYPKDGYRVLCFNCNMATAIYGVCPHHPAISGRGL